MEGKSDTQIEDVVSVLRSEYNYGEGNAIKTIVSEITSDITASELVRIKKEIGEERKGAHPQLLLEEVRGRIDRAREESKQIDEAIQSLRREARITGEIGSALSVEGLSQGDNSVTGDRGKVLLESASRTVDRTAELEERYRELLHMVEEDADLIKEASGDPKRDPKTGMATGGGLVESNAVLFREIYKMEDVQDRKDKLEYTYFVIKDMMLFHRGLIELGEGFDDRLKNYLTAGMISIAEYLAEGDSGLYWELSPKEIEVDRGLNLYFPVGSEIRHKLEELKALGVTVQPVRQNPGGGDEFGEQIDTNLNRKDFERRIKEEQGDNIPIDDDHVTRLMDEEFNRRKALVDEVISHVSYCTTFSKDRPVILDGEKREYSADEISHRKKIFRYFYDNLNLLIPAENESAGVTKEMSKFFFDFKNALRGYYMACEERYFTPGWGLLQSGVDLRMDYASVGNLFDYPILEDAEKYATNSEEYMKGGRERGEYLAALKIKLARKLSLEDIQDGRVFEEKLSMEIYKDILGKFQEYLFGEVNGDWKKRKKMQVLELASRGNSQAMFTVGSVKESGRDFGELNDIERRELWANSVGYWVGKYEVEKQKKEKGEKYNTDFVDGNFGAFIVKVQDYLRSTDENTGQTRWSSWISSKPNRSHKKR